MNRTKHYLWLKHALSKTSNMQLSKTPTTCIIQTPKHVPASGYDIRGKHVPARGYDIRGKQVPARGYDICGKHVPARGYDICGKHVPARGYDICGKHVPARGYDMVNTTMTDKTCVPFMKFWMLCRRHSHASRKSIFTCVYIIAYPIPISRKDNGSKNIYLCQHISLHSLIW